MSELEVISLEWEEFLKWFQQRWEPGQHMVLIAPTGAGKTTAVSQILPLRKYVMALDAKGGDSTLETLLQRGFERTPWPPKRRMFLHREQDIRRRIEEGKPARLLVGTKIKTSDDMPRLRREMALALRDAFNEGGWTVYCDEFQILTDPRLMNLRAPAEQNLIAARDRGVTMVMSFQSPTWVPTSAGKQATWFGVFYTRDRDVVAHLARMAGRPIAEMQGLVKGLPEFCFILFSRNPRAPVIVTKAKKLK